jgi:hypothetical protein
METETMDYLSIQDNDHDINNNIFENLDDLNDNEHENNYNNKSQFYNDVSNEELSFIRETIESMSKFNQIEVLRILQKCKDVTLSENKYGVHVNLSEVKKEIIDEMKSFINYVNTQEMNLFKLEEQKEKFKNTYFTKDNKDLKSSYNKVKVNA